MKLKNKPPSNRVRSFREDLTFSQDRVWLPFLFEVYQGSFRDFETMEEITNLKQQRLGIDRRLLLSSGKEVTVDEKIRRQFYDDILIEIWSSVEHASPGWIQKGLYCDYILYGFPGSGTAYLLPFQQLQSAFVENQDRWISNYKIIDAPNFRYTTRSLAVPTLKLLEAVTDSFSISVGPRRSNSHNFICRQCKEETKLVTLFHECASCDLLRRNLNDMADSVASQTIRGQQHVS